MNGIEKLIQECKQLPYTKTGFINYEVISKTESGINKLFEEYDYASVYGALSSVWSYEKAVEFFVKTDHSSPREKHSIKTVATSYFRAYNGGLERVNAELMNLWIRMGYNVVFFTDEPENSNDYSYPDAVKRIVIPSFDDIPARLEALQKHCISEQVDLFINNKWTDDRSVWECMLLKTMGIPYLRYCHGHFSICFVNGRKALFQPEAFSLCDMIIALSETNAKFYQLCGCRTYLVQNPIPEKLKTTSAPAGLDSERILMIGRLSEEKYPMEALEIFRLVLEKHPGAVLDVVGNGDENMLRMMKSYISSNSMEKSVSFHGLKTENEIAEFYKSAACVLFTSKMEGYPMIVLESKAYGLPLVMYDMPFLSLLKDCKGVLTANPGDIRSMAKNLIRVLDDEGFRKQLGAEARESFESFAGYDLEGAWRDMFNICAGGSAESEAYYEPEFIPVEDRLIIPSLFEKIKEGYNNTFALSSEYRLGSLLLRLPRKVRKVVRNKKREGIDR